MRFIATCRGRSRAKSRGIRKQTQTKPLLFSDRIFFLQVMQRDLSAVSGRKDIAVRQTRKGCLQELMGCEAKTEVRPLFRSEASKRAEDETSEPGRWPSERVKERRVGQVKERRGKGPARESRRGWSASESRREGSASESRRGGSAFHVFFCGADSLTPSVPLSLTLTAPTPGCSSLASAFSSPPVQSHSRRRQGQDPVRTRGV